MKTEELLILGAAGFLFLNRSATPIDTMAGWRDVNPARVVYPNVSGVVGIPFESLWAQIQANNAVYNSWPSELPPSGTPFGINTGNVIDLYYTL